MTDFTKKLPTRERILYDERFGTDTRYGLGPEQIFVNPDLAKSTITSILTDTDRKFTGVNIDNFITNVLDFSTPSAIIDTMNAIYDQFTPEDVNYIFFRVLEDAFSTKQEFEEIFKTSWVALQINQNVSPPRRETRRDLNLQPGGECFVVAITPTPTPSPSPTSIVPSPTPSSTVTPTPDVTPSTTPAVTVTPTTTPDVTPTVTATADVTSSPTPTPTPTPSATPPEAFSIFVKWE